MTSLNELVQEAKKDLEINELDVDNTIVSTQLMIGKWLEYQQKYKDILIFESIEYRRMCGLRTLYYYGKLSDKELNKLGWEHHGFLIKSKTELAPFVDSDEIIVPLKLKFDKLNQTLEFIDKTLDQINAKSWAIKNYIDWKKFESGIGY
jgi:hypothetical protein